MTNEYKSLGGVTDYECGCKIELVECRSSTEVSVALRVAESCGESNCPADSALHSRFKDFTVVERV